MWGWSGGRGGWRGGALHIQVPVKLSVHTSSLFPVDQLFQLFRLSVVRLKLEKTLNEAPRCVIVLHSQGEMETAAAFTNESSTPQVHQAHCHVTIAPDAASTFY